MNMKRMTAFAAIGVVATGLATPIIAQDMLMGADAIEKRQELMKSNGMTLRGAREATGADAIAAAETLVGNFAALADLWPADSMEGDTKALPEVWNDDGSLSEGFLMAYTNAASAADALLAAAQSGDTAAYGAAFGALGGSCGACHQSYKAE